VETVEMINDKVAHESINTVLRYLYQQKPDFGKVDEEVRVLRNLNRRVGLIIQKSLNNLTFTTILRTKVLSSFIMEALF